MVNMSELYTKMKIIKFEMKMGKKIYIESNKN